MWHTSRKQDLINFLAKFLDHHHTLLYGRVNTTQAKYKNSINWFTINISIFIRQSIRTHLTTTLKTHKLTTQTPMRTTKWIPKFKAGCQQTTETHISTNQLGYKISEHETVKYVQLIFIEGPKPTRKGAIIKCTQKQQAETIRNKHSFEDFAISAHITTHTGKRLKQLKPPHRQPSLFVAIRSVFQLIKQKQNLENKVIPLQNEFDSCAMWERHIQLQF